MFLAQGSDELAEFLPIHNHLNINPWADKSTAKNRAVDLLRF
jgi:hypothetical protein